MTIKTGRTRSTRNLIYEQIRRDLEKLGYHPLRPIFLDRFMRYRLIVVAVNHLATLLQRDPYRVYQALLCRAERTALGQPFTPYKQAKATPTGLSEGERRGGLHVWCPHCGADLLTSGPVTKAEVDREFKSRNSPHNSPHFSEKNICARVEDSTSGGRVSGCATGHGGMGGGDPGGGASERR